MSPIDRDRAREKRRYEKRQSALAQRAAQARRNKQVLGVILAMIVVIGGVVGLSLALNKDDTTVASSQASGAPTDQATDHGTDHGTDQATSAPPTAATKVAGCVAPPKVPTDKRTGTLPNKSTAAGKTFIATVTTNCGVLTLELDGTKAPQTVASFLSLAKSGYWADSPCHRLVTAGIFVLQCGDPTGTGQGGPGYGFGVENPPADSTYAPGQLAMARTPDPKKGNGGQFFIVYKETKLPDPDGYSIFGKVTSGMDIVDKIAAAGIGKDPAPMQPISILKVDVAEKKA